MHTNLRHSLVPFERYCSLMTSLTHERDAWEDAYWLRFAAQVAVLCPDSPPALAQHIRTTANELLRSTAWYQTLASPARFVVAAMLIQHQIPPTDFISEHAHAAALMSEVGLRHDRFYEIVAVLILMMNPGHRSPSKPDIERIKEIYNLMKGTHWWLTGPDDLPACSGLAQCVGSAKEVVARTEVAYQQLHAAGIPLGEHLQTAANLLPLAGLDMAKMVSRYRNLVANLQERNGTLTEDHYNPLALLTLLDHESGIVIGHLLDMIQGLDRFQPESRGEVNILIASDLTFLDLARSDRQLTTLSELQAAAYKARALHTFHVASAILVTQVDSNLVQIAAVTTVPQWPFL